MPMHKMLLFCGEEKPLYYFSFRALDMEMWNKTADEHPMQIRNHMSEYQHYLQMANGDLEFC